MSARAMGASMLMYPLVRVGLVGSHDAVLRAASVFTLEPDPCAEVYAGLVAGDGVHHYHVFRRPFRKWMRLSISLSCFFR